MFSENYNLFTDPLYVSSWAIAVSDTKYQLMCIKHDQGVKQNDIWSNEIPAAKLIRWTSMVCPDKYNCSFAPHTMLYTIVMIQEYRIYKTR